MIGHSRPKASTLGPRANLPLISQCIADNVPAPADVHGDGHAARQALDGDPFPRTPPHRQSGVAVHALHALPIHRHALATQQPV
jgi:hypothetical protein